MVKALWLGMAGLAFAAAATPASAQARLFSEDTQLNVSIEAPLNKLIRAAKNSTDPFPGTFTLHPASGAAQLFPMQISARGFTRRTGDFCNFPPLKLDFDRPALQGTLMQGQNKLKLVTHCRPQAAYEQQLVLEYTAYRLYNAVTPLSFRVRPLQVTYHDTDGQRPDVTKFGFVIEDADELAKRNGRVELEVQPNQVSSTQLDAPASALYALFQFMIGNLDWEYVTGPPGDTCCHNSKILAREGATSGHMPVPYDFDFSGFVDAPYAVPPDSINVPSVRARYYRGFCRTNDQLSAAAAVMRDHRAAFAAVIAGEARLTAGNRERSQKYIDDFFEILDNPTRFEREITRRCR